SWPCPALPSPNRSIELSKLKATAASGHRLCCWPSPTSRGLTGPSVQAESPNHARSGDRGECSERLCNCSSTVPLLTGFAVLGARGPQGHARKTLGASSLGVKQVLFSDGPFSLLIKCVASSRSPPARDVLESRKTSGDGLPILRRPRQKRAVSPSGVPAASKVFRLNGSASL